MDVDPVRKRQREVALLESQINSELKGGDTNGAGPNSALAKFAATANAAGGEEQARAEFAKLLSTRSGGAYIPPARLRAMQAEASKDKSSPEYQRLSWDALRKSINGMINKVSHLNVYEDHCAYSPRSTSPTSSTSFLSSLARTSFAERASLRARL